MNKLANFKIDVLNASESNVKDLVKSNKITLLDLFKITNESIKRMTKDKSYKDFYESEEEFKEDAAAFREDAKSILELSNEENYDLLSEVIDHSTNFNSLELDFDL